MRTLLALFAATLAATAAEPARFAAHTIATELKGGYQVVPVDLNRDGRIDLIALASGMTELVWFENPGWERHVIAGNLNRMINLAAADIDGDGIPEIVLATGFNNVAKNSVGIVSVLTHNGDPRQPWTAREIDRLTTSHRIRTADIDGSGKRVFVNAPLTGPDADAAGLSRAHAAGLSTGPASGSANSSATKTRVWCTASGSSIGTATAATKSSPPASQRH